MLYFYFLTLLLSVLSLVLLVYFTLLSLLLSLFHFHFHFHFFTFTFTFTITFLVLLLPLLILLFLLLGGIQNFTKDRILMTKVVSFVLSFSVRAVKSFETGLLRRNSVALLSRYFPYGIAQEKIDTPL